ncbi:flagellar assembly protein FliW [Phosphitispora fastidiosa]|uniref:flagellar assembly protein FliW n=1 Tax=Phosphitispora fastidiosa TaxID=2837202 RepID=UPI001E46EEB2|nr:flagellar assembly protein FliW [Phosphitispora fastidiosa]MBU7006411.1 flagellar assembly factor FliW [Phosphitispora fastidiosa]
MIVKTRRFGDLTVEEQDIITMIGGLPGFEDNTKYALLDHDEKSPYKWLQSLENSELAFVVMEPFVFFADYQFELSQNDIRELEVARPEDVAVLVILVIPENPTEMTANIKAPLVINMAKMKGKQIVLNNEAYPVKLHLFQQ